MTTYAVIPANTFIGMRLHTLGNHAASACVGTLRYVTFVADDNAYTFYIDIAGDITRRSVSVQQVTALSDEALVQLISQGEVSKESVK